MLEVFFLFSTEWEPRGSLKKRFYSAAETNMREKSKGKYEKSRIFAHLHGAQVATLFSVLVLFSAFSGFFLAGSHRATPIPLVIL
jgi:hypothetical protein